VRGALSPQGAATKFSAENKNPCRCPAAGIFYFD